MFVAGIKLNMKAVPLATAAQVYHRFFQECRLEDYDPYVSIYDYVVLSHDVMPPPRG